jgi:hypothetical protein
LFTNEQNEASRDNIGCRKSWCFSTGIGNTDNTPKREGKEI